MGSRIERTRALYERAVYEGDAEALDEADRVLDAVAADLALSRGRIAHTRFLLDREADPERAHPDPGELGLFEQALSLYQGRGDRSGEAEALFWIGCFHQVVHRDYDTARPYLERSLDLADDPATRSEALRHLGIIAHFSGQLDEARGRLEESTRLRRDLGLSAAVASNLIGLAYVSMGQGRSEDASAALAEARTLAEASGARRISRSVEEAQANIE
jgi:tetratricopeptide (TPR) repeat protein